ncbi:unnamed protein product [Ectocarpus sp. 6 AP-2014]
MGRDAVSGMFRVALVLAFLCPGVVVRVASHQASLGTATANRPASIAAATGTNLRAQTSRTLQSGDTPAPATGSTTVVTSAPFVAEDAPAPTPGPMIAVTSAPFVPADADSTCSNGFPGVESENGKTCCLTSCGFCAGDGCSNQGNATDCCATEISLHGEECDIAGSAPCYVVTPEEDGPEHTLVYFTLFFIIPFIVIAVVCNATFPRWCRGRDPDAPLDEAAATAHLQGHNTSPRRVPRPRRKTATVGGGKEAVEAAATGGAEAVKTCEASAATPTPSHRGDTPSVGLPRIE